MYALAVGVLSLAVGRAVSRHWISVGEPARMLVFAAVVALVSVLSGIAFDPLRSGLRRAAHRLRDRRP